MKKSTMTTIVLAMVLVLGAFWGYLKFSTDKGQAIPVDNNQMIVEPTSERGDEVNEDTTQSPLDEMTIVQDDQNENKDSKDKSEEVVTKDLTIKSLGEVSLISPVYELKGKAPAGATRINVTWLNKTTKETLSYDLNKFKAGDKEFLTRMRIDYGNINKGENEYTIKFYSGEEKNVLTEIQQFTLIANYKEIIGKDTVVYYDNSQEAWLSEYDKAGNVYLQVKSKNDKVTMMEGANKVGQGLVYKYKGKYGVTYDTVIVNNSQKFSFIAKNKGLADKQLGIAPTVVADLYTLDNELVAKKIPIIGRSTGGEYTTSLHLNENGTLGFTLSDGDVCRWFSQLQYVYIEGEKKGQTYIDIIQGSMLSQDGDVIQITKGDEELSVRNIALGDDQVSVVVYAYNKKTGRSNSTILGSTTQSMNECGYELVQATLYGTNIIIENSSAKAVWSINDFRNPVLSLK